MALVRIIIPTYNKASLLAEALKSVLRQSFSDFDVIVVDDGSTDDTELTLQRFAAKDSRVGSRQVEGAIGRPCVD
jgi:glycosyltransferase involved in cell wall biosynthesis